MRKPLFFRSFKASQKDKIGLILVNTFLTHELQKFDHIEPSQLICSSNQLADFYVKTTLAFNELINVKQKL